MKTTTIILLIVLNIILIIKFEYIKKQLFQIFRTGKYGVLGAGFKTQSICGRVHVEVILVVVDTKVFYRIEIGRVARADIYRYGVREQRRDFGIVTP